jgi:DNA (cytosine-5)-methyltransferase 1
MPRSKITFIDLFCGIGGFHYALKANGAKCKWACDWDPNARKTYKANHGIEPWGDITEAEFVSKDFDGIIKVNQIPPHDILCAGFPCQPFSLAGVSKKLSLGRKHGFDDPTQGNLFFELAKIIKHYQPKAFILENVKNLRSHDSGRTFIEIYNTLHQLGYHLHTQIIDAQHFVPQHRERIFIVGFKDPLPFEFPSIRASRGKHHGQRPTLIDILENNPDPKYTLSDKLWSYLKNYAKKHKDAGNGFGFELCGPNDTSRTLSARYYKDGSEILIKQQDRNPRRLTPNECRKLMGYPDSFVIPVSDGAAYKLFGNSVVVPVVTSIAESVIKTLNQFEYNKGKVLRTKKISSNIRSPK